MTVEMRTIVRIFVVIKWLLWIYISLISFFFFFLFLCILPLVKLMFPLTFLKHSFFSLPQYILLCTCLTFHGQLRDLFFFLFFIFFFFFPFLIYFYFSNSCIISGWGKSLAIFWLYMLVSPYLFLFLSLSLSLSIYIYIYIYIYQGELKVLQYFGCMC